MPAPSDLSADKALQPRERSFMCPFGINGSLTLSSLAFAYYDMHRFDEGKRITDRALAIGEKLDDKECISRAYGSLCCFYNYSHADQPAEIVERIAKSALPVAETLENPFSQTMLEKQDRFSLPAPSVPLSPGEGWSADGRAG